MEILRNCPICGKNNKSITPFYIMDEKWKLKSCGGCNFVYLENTVNYVELQEKYAWEKTSVVESHSRKKKEPLLYSLSSLLKSIKTHIIKRNKLYFLFKKHYLHGTVLDIGCAQGGLICTLREKMNTNFIPLGIEISNKLAKIGNDNLSKYGGKVIHSDAINGLGQMASGSISMIIMSSFLEHELHPSECIKQAHRVLLDKGIVLIKVPNFNSINRVVRKEKWCGYRIPDHQNYFTPTTLTSLAISKGFKVRQCNIFDRLPTSDTMYTVLEKQ
ncbi:MAG: class I SAM-dependent methyltransferase [Deltaproteobacteria bacterium]|nr:class I SAM-dependent methyltransferase [Deltaproteobacteria bacterium]